jgi:hypothetical protein
LGYSAAIPAVTMLWWSLAKTSWQSLPRFWRDPYRPELHYMRSEKHSGRFEQGTLEHDRADSAGANHRLSMITSC